MPCLAARVFQDRYTGAMLPTLTLLLACGASAPPLTPLAVGPATVPTVPGDPDRKMGSAQDGLLGFKTADVDQVLSWSAATAPLAAEAQHEIDLVEEALEGAVQGKAHPEPGKVAGQPALIWTVDGGSTHFVGLAFDCAGTRVILTTFGPDARKVRSQHARSLAGATCAAP